MGLDVKSLKNAEIEYLKQNAVILWGEAYEMLHRTLESRPRRLPRKQAPLPKQGFPIHTGGRCGVWRNLDRPCPIP
jgi:hypothetical protein